MAADIEIKGHVFRELQSPTGRVRAFRCILCHGIFKRVAGILHGRSIEQAWNDESLPACTFVRVRVAP